MNGNEEILSEDAKFESNNVGVVRSIFEQPALAFIVIHIMQHSNNAITRRCTAHSKQQRGM